MKRFNFRGGVEGGGFYGGFFYPKQLEFVTHFQNILVGPNLFIFINKKMCHLKFCFPCSIWANGWVAKNLGLCCCATMIAEHGLLVERKF